MLLKVTCFFFFLTAGFLISLPAQNEAFQNIKYHFDAFYGKDNQLYSGTLYYPKSGIKGGVPFFGETSDAYEANIWIRGIKYLSQPIRYDLIQQSMVLQFNDHVGAQREIILNPNLIDSISFPDHRFIPNPFEEIDHHFIEVVYEGELSCYIGWTKEETFRTTGDNAGYYYLNARPAFYLLKNNSLYFFKNRRSFLQLFSEENRKAIKSHMAQNQLNFKRMDTNQIEKLIRFCEETIQ